MTYTRPAFLMLLVASLALLLLAGKVAGEADRGPDGPFIPAGHHFVRPLNQPSFWWQQVSANEEGSWLVETPAGLYLVQTGPDGQDTALPLGKGQPAVEVVS